ncbi:NAD(P)/FAD-dependent oxidoreductase [Nonomuraea sp. NPDC005650]|uniref:flavin-containing monooxygenase n=1 Tax=Nonomuraea sp. NPDC005650 TaxID=3157045 RepID=UPI0033BBB38C
MPGEREHARSRTIDIAIIGAGIGGIAAAVNLVRRDIRTFVIFEKSAGPGGTWWDNRYPGAECDVPSALYSYSFKSHDWTRTHARQAEIQAYIEETIDDFGIRANLRFGTAVESAQWDDQRQQYLVTTATGEARWFDVVVSAVGMLNVPKIPDWPGIDSFEGPLFHSARWDPAVDLDGKCVAVVGAGASAAQVVPALQPRVTELLSFQREPGWVLPKGDHDYTSDQRAELNRFGRRKLERWRVLRAMDKGGGRGDPNVVAAQRNRLETRIASVFEDHPELRDALTPDFQPRCKRNVLSDGFYAALLEPNVRLITRSVERITPRGVVDDRGEEHEADIVVLTTGFQAANFLGTLRVTGRGGRDLHETWGDDPKAFLGITVPGFPNFYMLYGPNTHGTVVSFVLERQAEFVARDVRRLRRGGGGTIEVRQAADVWYQRVLQEAIDAVETWKSGCHNFYLSASGRNVVQWPWTHRRYHVWARLLRRWSSSYRPLTRAARLARQEGGSDFSTSREAA